MELRTDRYKLKEIFPERAKKYAQRLHVKADEIEYVRKGIPIDPAEISIEEGERAAIRLITTPRLDRDGEILIPDGAILDDFRQSPSVLFGHQYDRLPVGKDVWIKPVKKGVLAKTVYATHQFAEDDFQCVKGGFLNANSVGFIPVEHVRQDDSRFKDLVDRLEKEYGVPREEAQAAKAIYTKWLLLEHSDVPVASNAQSLNLAVSKGELVLDSKSMKEELGIPVSPEGDLSPEAKPTFTGGDFKQKIEGQDSIVWTAPLVPLTAGAVQPKIGICDTCGAPFGPVVTKPETTENYHRIPVSEGHEGHKIRTINVESGVKALYCVDCKEVMTYLFDVDKFTMEEGRAWIREHGKRSVAWAETIRKWGEDNPDGIKLSIDTLKEICPACAEKLQQTNPGIQEIKIHPEKQMPEQMLEGLCNSIGEDPGFFTRCMEHSFGDFAPDKERFCAWLHHECLGIWPGEQEAADVPEQKDVLTLRGKRYVERWNKSLSKLFDVAAVDQPAATWELDLCTKFLECEVKNIFQNNFLIPCPLLGTYLSAFQAVCADFQLLDTRNFDYSGREYPPNFEVIQLTSIKSEDFLIEGTRFYRDAKDQFILRFTPNWMGIQVSVITKADRREWNKSLLARVHAWVKEHNFLKGEIFALNGEFLSKTDDAWDNLILDARTKDPIQKTVAYFKKNGKDAASRGMLFMGPAGTGKTKTGRVMLNDPGSTFIWVSSRDFKDHSPITALTLAFQLARDLAPTVLFIEDIDTWLRDFTVDLLKTELDGIRQNKGILTILTSNYPEKLPDTLLDRPGRFHHVLNFALPNTEQRLAMLKLWVGEINPGLVNQILSRTVGLSGAHMKELVDFAKIIAEEDGIDMGQALLKSLKQIEEQRDLIGRIRHADKKQVKANGPEDGEEIEIEEAFPVSLSAPPSIVPEEIVIDAKPEIEIEDDTPAPEKSAEELVEAYVKSGDFDKAVAEAVKVAIAKLRGKVI